MSDVCPDETSYVKIICSFDEVIQFNPKNKDTLPPVIQRMLGLVEGEFAPPKTDEEGNLTFAKDFGVSRVVLLRLFLFFRTGVLPDAPLKVEEMTSYMEIFGGCDKLDAAVNSLHTTIVQEKMNAYNPMTPEEDVLHEYIWCQSMRNPDEEGWSVTILIPDTSSFYYRKQKTSK